MNTTPLGRAVDLLVAMMMTTGASGEGSWRGVTTAPSRSASITAIDSGVDGKFGRSNGGARLGRLAHFADFVRGVAAIDRAHDPAGADDAHVQRALGQAVVRQHRHPVARLQPIGLQHRRHARFDHSR